ncbi:zinc finger protein Xfin-like [Saccostrea echinata]|uniref:zinc finger protein Xfin-like n=1 Tax=Saccostrea echinata TaxID=191078 RepID=UPI002A82E536|nr:zinc finger protein Xfin-like [Saccostrea echinata]
MGKNKAVNLPLHKCDLCEFATKNIYIFKRHRVRCKKERKKTKGKTKSAVPMFASAATAKGITISRIRPKESTASDSHATPKSTDGKSSESQSLVPGKAKNRSYYCSECGFSTGKSRTFLFHQVEAHTYNMSIFTCAYCEYCSRFKQKIKKHVQMVHKTDIDSADIETLYEAKSNVKTPMPKLVTSKSQDSLEGLPTMVKAERSNRVAAVSKGTITNSVDMDIYIEEVVSSTGHVNFKCRKCAFNNPDRGFVQKHVNSSHLNAKQFSCTLCDFKTTKKIEFFAHKAEHGNAGDQSTKVQTQNTDAMASVPSQQCEMEYSTYYEETGASGDGGYEQACHTEHSEGMRQTKSSAYQCSECDYSTDFKPNYERHRNNHTNSFANKCNFCSFSSDNDRAIIRHMATSHSSIHEDITVVIPHAPEEEDEAAVEIDTTRGTIDQSNHGAMDQPQVEQMEYEVDDSREVTPNSVGSDPKEHVVAKYSYKLQAPDGTYACPWCGLKYKRSWDLDRHMKLKHNKRMRNHLLQMLQEEQNDSLEAMEDMSYHSDSSNLNSSDLSNQQSFTAEDLKCQQCSFVGKLPSDVKRHSAVHSMEKRYKCPECSKQYKYVGDLNVHLRRDHKMEPSNVPILRVPMVPNRKSSPAMFKCPSCSFASPWKSEVDRHSRKHKDSKPFRCNYCKYQTHWKGDIRRHMFKHHPAVMTGGVKIEEVITILENKIKEKGGRSSQMDVDSEDGKYAEDLSENNDSNLSDPSMQSDMYGHLDNDNEESNISSNTENSFGNDGTNSRENSRSVSPSPSKDTVFKCEYCPFTTNAPSKLSAHVSTHTNLKQYMCPVCGRRANWKWDIRKHIKRDHPESSLDVVKMSEQEAEATIKSYMDTMPVVRREHHLNYDPTAKESKKDAEALSPKWKGYKCAACGFKSSMRWTVSRHIRTVHNGKAIDIVYHGGDEKGKNNKSDNSTDLPSTSNNNRQSTEKSDKPYMCAECGKKCAFKADIKKHYHYIHPYMDVKIIYIEGSSGTLLSPEDLKPKSQNKLVKLSKVNPAEAHKPFRCGEPNCEKRTNSQGDMKRHYSFIHPNMEVKIYYKNETTRRNIDEPLSGKSTPTPTNKPLVSANPKVFGYIKPFKCSACGHRSNWKWDLNKHMRMKHPNMHATVITMDEDEAKRTYHDYMRQLAAANNANQNKSVEKPKTPEKEKYHRDKMPSRSVFKQFKCSACPYRSNWRSDLVRHIKRKHGVVRAKIILLGTEEAKKSLTEYEYNPRFRRNTMKTLEKKDSGRIWKCARCKFTNKDKLLVIKHLSSHGVKAYKCNECHYATNYRSSAFRHIKAKHGTENMSVCKVSIKYIRDLKAECDVAREEDNNSEKVEEESEESDYLSDDKEDTMRYIESFRCKLCTFQANWRSSVCRHIRQTHKTKDYSNLIDVVHKFYQSEEKKRTSSSSSDKMQPPKDDLFKQPSDPKKHKCGICPYRTSKPNLLHFHESCHKPQPGILQEKCKFCPYYVVAKRLLHQHMRLHLQDMYLRQKEAANMKSTPTKKMSMFPPQSPSGTPKRYKCNICPYTTNSKNDFLYHKQFHRQRSTSEFKCDYCDYWVTHKRLINQHMRMHEAAGHSPGNASPVSSSPCKSDITESSAIQDTVTLAMYKQRMISSKITPSISQKPAMSPMKIACSVGNRPGYALKNGVYRKMHTCDKCPYMNLRLRNLRLHQLMHGFRKSKNLLLKCPHCDYYVGSKGLLSHHLKVHQPSYRADTSMDLSLELENGEESAPVMEEMEESSSDVGDISYDNKVDTLYEIARWKKYSCEKCPYASAKKSHYERHVALHGSKQRCQCLYCDYSVPSNNLLNQHQKLHMTPNQNLLAVQSLSNLQMLSEVPADVALSSALPPLDKKGTFSVSVTHDHMDMYENSPELDIEPKKLYRCDRCPYANVRRDHLLAHLKFHMIKSELACPYCDYSVSKQHLLTQHIGVHFCPLPELSSWLAQNGEIDRVKQTKNPDLSEALFVAELYRADGCGKANLEDTGSEDNEKTSEAIKGEKETDNSIEENGSASIEENTTKFATNESSIENVDKKPTEPDQMDDNKTENTKEMANVTENEPETIQLEERPEMSQTEPETAKTEMENYEYICQYCEREFSTSDILVKHEMQHLVGNNYEEYMTQVQMLAELSDAEEEDLLGEEMSDVEMMEDQEEDEGADSVMDDGHEEVDDEVSFKKDSTLDSIDDIYDDADMKEEEKSNEEEEEEMVGEKTEDINEEEKEDSGQGGEL